MTLFKDLRRWLKRDRLRLLGRLFLLAAKGFFKDDGPTWAAAIAHYSLLRSFHCCCSLFSLPTASCRCGARAGVRRRWARRVATVVFLAAEPLFLGYVETLARHNVVYGSLAGIVTAVIWAWVVAMIGLFGGQITSHCQSVLFDGEPIEDVERRHLARADAPPRRKLS